MPTLEALINYTPALVQRHHAHNSEQPPEPTAKRYESTLLMIETIGFFSCSNGLHWNTI
ncbi:hypothetical protein [Candidatus Albibeggiatoa sp. nov. BB20]|uniref:hypothetical protein n=1 Tax=Candidatus Albibeggiatoa sp. nov. BB20 TaxID=3162723 RepID=UPI0033654962